MHVKKLFLSEIHRHRTERGGLFFFEKYSVFTRVFKLNKNHQEIFALMRSLKKRQQEVSWNVYEEF